LNVRRRDPNTLLLHLLLALLATPLVASCGADAAPAPDTASADAIPADADPGDAADTDGPDADPPDADPPDASPVDSSAPDATPDATDAPGPLDVDAAADGVAWSDALFDMAALGDAVAAECAFTHHATTLKNGVLVDVWRVAYDSVESVDGVLRPIRVRGFAARPAGGQDLAGVVVAHGLGGFSRENDAVDAAARLGVFALAYTGPGGGTEPANSSEGLGAGHADGYRLFDVLADPRGSWFWAHTAAALRGLTCLADHPAVDPTRLGMTGYSAGGVATLLATSVDPRIQAAVPLSGTGGWDVATESAQAWQHTLLAAAGLDVASAEWATLIEALDATRLLPGATGAILLVNGSTDEFFPLTAHLATYDAIGSPTRRTAIAANLDHGCYALTGVESAANIEARALIRANGGQAFWFGHHLGTDGRFATVPAEPTVSTEDVGPATLITATVDEAGPAYLVDKVTFWFSDDHSAVYLGVDLDRASPGVWQKLAPGNLPAHAIIYVDVQYRTPEVLAPARFAIASRPHIPDGLVPRIRAIDTCLPP